MDIYILKEGISKRNLPFCITGGEGKYYFYVVDSVYAISHFASISLDSD